MPSGCAGNAWLHPVLILLIGLLLRSIIAGIGALGGLIWLGSGCCFRVGT